MQRKWKRRWQRLTKLVLPSVAAGMLFFSIYSPLYAAPAGGTVTSGSASIAANGATTTITQTSNKAAINWQSFNIAKGETVHFVQPSASSVALNRVVGSNASSIYGTLSANGKVFLINPSGILFAPGSQVSVGGLVASTLTLSDSDFLSGKYTWQKDGSAGSVINQGTITAANEAVLIGSQAANEGVIAAKVTGLAAGNTVSLDFSGDNLLNIAVDTGAVGGSVTNTGTITSAGGLVVMTAGTKNALLHTVVNNSGVIRAQSVHNENGVIRLEGSTVVNAGTLDASGKAAGQTGGTVKLLGDTVTVKAGSTIDVSGDAGGGTGLIGGNYQGSGSEYTATNTTVESGARINADAITQGSGGKVVLWANDTTQFAGTIYAKGGSASGNGGSVEVSGKRALQLNELAQISTTAANGTTGSLLLDPAELTVDASNVSTYTDLLAQNNTTVSTSSGDLAITTPISWSSATTLTLDSAAGISISAPITATNGGLTVTANGTVTDTAAVNVRTFTLTKGTWRQIAGTLPSFSATDFRISGGTFLRAKGGDGTIDSPYQITDVYGLQGIGSAGMLGSAYTLANTIDASGTQYWNSYLDGGTTKYNGFNPIGIYDYSNPSKSFTGDFDGLGHTIIGLTINRPSTTGVGLFGSLFSSSILNVGLSAGSVTGSSYVGGLIGYNNNSNVKNVYSTSSVSAFSNVGGLVGVNAGRITNAYSTGSVSGYDSVGGLIGSHSGSITNVYSSGSVSGSSRVGGLIGLNWMDEIPTNAYWDKNTSTQTNGTGWDQFDNPSANVIGLSDAFDKVSYTGFDFTTTWYMVDSQTRPFLRSEYSTTITNAHQLQLMALNLTASYTLAKDIDMSELTNPSGLWRTKTTVDVAGQYGFIPIGNYSTPFTGTFNGLGHTINGLTIYRPSLGNVGLFGVTNAAAIRNVSLSDVSMTGDRYVGGLVGWNRINSTIENANSSGSISGSFGVVGGIAGMNAGTIENAYSSGSVSGDLEVGGLVGENNSIIKKAYSTSSVSARVGQAGGLVGANYSEGTIENAYSTGSVSALLTSAGGLVGMNYAGGIINNAYSTGSVSAPIDAAGGLVGRNYSGNTISNAYYAITNEAGSTINSGIGYSTYGEGKTLVQLQQLATFSSWDIDNAGGTGKAWRIYDGYTTPLLRSLLTQITVTATPAGKSYDGSAASGNNLTYTSDPAASSGLLSAPSGLSYSISGKNAGTYKTTDGTLTFSGLYSTQQGYDITYAPATLTITPITLTVTATGFNKPYDTSTAASVTFGDNRIAGDILTVSGTAAFNDKNAGTGKVVSVSSISLSGADAINYTYNTTATTTADIAKATLNVSNLAANNKVYDGNTTATVSGTLNGILGSDTVTLGGGTFNDKNAGTGKAVTVSTLTGVDAGNYTLAATATADITQAVLTVTAAGVSKTYDGTRDASVTYSDNRISGDVLIATGIAAFDDKNAGTGKAVGISGISLSGADAGNYTYNTNAATTADITKAALTITAAGVNKPYDGNTDASVTYSDNRISGDVLTVTGSAAFKNKNAGTGKAVDVSALSLSGADAVNYTYNTAAATTADIAKAALTVSNLAANNKVYDGNTTATVSGTLTGSIGSDAVTLGNGSFNNKNAGTGKAVTVTLTGADAANYTLQSATTLADITPAILTVTATGVTKTYDATTAASVTFGDNRIAGDVLTVSGTATFNDKNAGNSKGVNVSAISLAGTDAANYTYNTVATTTADITKASLTVTANSASKVYNGQAYTGGSGVTYTGFVNGETQSVLGGTLNYGGTSQGALTPGTYTLSVFGLASTNYAITYQPSVLTITGRVSNPAYDGAVIHANHTALSGSRSQFGPRSMYPGPLSGYLTGATSTYAPLIIVGPGINLSGYPLLTVPSILNQQ